MSLKTLAAGTAAVALLGLSTAAAAAGTFYVQTTPAGAAAMFSPSDTLTFDSFAPGIYSSATEGLLTFTSDSGALHIDGDYIGNYSTFGVNSVHSCYCSDSFSQLNFAFSSPLQGFGFFWGASDTPWTLTAYDASNAVVQSFVLPVTHFSNAGDFVGVFGSGITHATLKGDASDYVFVDDVTFGVNYVGPTGGAPEPATWAMMILGLAGVGAALRSGRRRSATA